MTSEEAQRLAYRVRVVCRMICEERDRIEILRELDEIVTELEEV